VLASLAETVRVISILLSPYMPRSAQKLLDAMSAPDLRLEAAAFGALGDGRRTVTELPPMFPKRPTAPEPS
jgi:methionyl-tRNA synthetase